MKNREVVLWVALLATVTLSAVLGVVILQHHGRELAALHDELRMQTWEANRQIKEMQDRMASQQAQLTEFGRRLSPQNEKEAIEDKAVGSSPPKSDLKNPDGSYTYCHTGELLAMTPRRLKFLYENPCLGTFEDANGQKVYIGGPAGSLAVLHFVFTLQRGKTYPMPGAFIDFIEAGGLERKAVPEHAVEDKF